MSSGSVSESSSVASNGSLDRHVDPICVDLVLVPVWIVWVPLAVLPAGSTGVAWSPHILVGPAPASEAGAIAAVWCIGAATLDVDVTGPSLPVCPLVATILLLSKSSFASCLQFTIITVQVAL